MNGAPSTHTDTHTQLSLSVTFRVCRASHLPSAVSLPAVRAAAVSKVSAAPYANAFLFFMMWIPHLWSSPFSPPVRAIPPSIPIFPLIAFLHYITCPPHRPHNSSSFPLSIPPLLQCSQISVYSAGRFTFGGIDQG